MKAIALFLTAACLAHATHVPTHTADKPYLIKQKSIYELYWHVDQPTVYHPELYQKARSFNLEDNVASFTDQTAVTELLQRLKHGMLPRGEMFFVNVPQQYEEFINLFHVLHTAKDFDTFYNTAVWMRFHVNELMYVYALSIAVLHRPDTKNIRLPPIYEVVPQYFFNEEVIHKANRIAMGDTQSIVPGYYPTMQHPNGVSLPQRPVGFEVPLHAHIDVQALQDFHVRISDAIDSGYLVDANGKHINIYDTMDGLNHLSNVIHGNADSVNPTYYGHIDPLYRKVFGISPVHITKHHATSLDMLSTRLRDPLFYGICKNIVTYWERYKQHLPKYTHEELVFPGVTVESVTVDKLTTFFDHFESLISNAVSVRSHKEAQSMLIKARQYRLNHKPFTYHITVNSDKPVKAIFRVFLGPKNDVNGHEIDMSENYKNFLEMDQWIVDLKTGANKIERSSHESIYVVPDEVSSDVLYKKVVKALEGGETFTYPGQLYGFPDRLILPRGKKEGMPFKLFVAVSHFDETKAMHVDNPVLGLSVVDTRPLGYPLDRVPSFNFTVPNFYFKDVLVFHKQAEELNLTV